MPQPQLTNDVLVEALNLAELHGSAHLACKAGATKLARNTLEGRILRAQLLGLRPTVNKEAPRILTRERLGKMHLVIPDVQSKPGVPNEHLEWIGNYIQEKKPDVIVMIGDFWDFPSLCSYDRGKLDFEGRRYLNDVKAGRIAMEKLLAPIKYNPRKVFTLGNHEHRVVRIEQEHPEFEGMFTYRDLGLEDYGWEVHDFLEVVKIDGIEYSHYFTSGVMGRAASSAAVVLRERQCSATQGHVQHTDIAMHKRTQQIALFAGTCYLHDEDYLGPQNNSQRRQIVVKNEVEDGRYDPMFVSLRFLEKAYS